jgi:hypothetical protein
VVLSLQRKKRISSDSELARRSFAQRTVRPSKKKEVGMHSNEKLLRDADEAQTRGDAEAFAGFYTDDVIVHIPGKSSFAGVYEGRISSSSCSGGSRSACPSTRSSPMRTLRTTSTGSSFSGRTTSAATRSWTRTIRSSVTSATARSRSSGSRATTPTRSTRSWDRPLPELPPYRPARRAEPTRRKRPWLTVPAKRRGAVYQKR